jgi:beta-N-acetylhexosaminidase
MTLPQKIGQLLMVSVPGQEISPEICQFVQELAPGGVFYRPENILTSNRLRRYSADLQACALAVQDIPLFASLDHEGQYADRFDETITQFPIPGVGATGDPSLAYGVSLAGAASWLTAV